MIKLFRNSNFRNLHTPFLYISCRGYSPVKEDFSPPEGIILNDDKCSFGDLKDDDRIFQNLYGRLDWRLKGACLRGDWYKTKELICKGPDWIMDEITKSGLRGRGGGGFWVATKWNFLKDSKSTKPKVIIVNAAEGEPGTCKDREIVRHEPHKLLEGMLLAGWATGACRGIVYIRGKFYNEACNLQFALAEAYRYGLIGNNACESGYDFHIHIQRGNRYICGEETALIKCLMGEQGRPRRRPPYISEKGYFDAPSSVINTETISVLPTILRRGSKWFASLGRSYNSGTKLFSISGNVNNPCTVEEEMSTPLKKLIDDHAGGVVGGWDNVKVVFPGGSSTPLIDKKTADDILMDFDCLAGANSSLGTAAVIVINKKTDILKLMYNVIKFYKEETCKQCNQCREGSIFLTEIFSRFAQGNAEIAEVDWINVIAKWIGGNTICSLGDAQAAVATSVAKYCRKDLEERIKDFGK